MADEDLEFLLKINADDSQVEKVLQGISVQLENQKQQLVNIQVAQSPSLLKELLGLQQRIGAEQQKGLLAQLKARDSVGPTALLQQLDLERQITTEKLKQQLTSVVAKTAGETADDMRERLSLEQQITLVKQHQGLEELKAGYDPDLLKVRLEIERQVTEERQRQQLATVAIQAGESPDEMRERLSLEQQITLIRQHQGLEELKTGYDPNLLKVKLEIERQVTAEKQRQQLAALASEGLEDPKDLRDRLDIERAIGLEKQKSRLASTLAEGWESPDSMRERLSIEQQIGLAKQRQGLEELKVGYDPETLKEKLDIERQVTRERQLQQLVALQLGMGESPDAMKSRLGLERQIGLERQKQQLEELKSSYDPEFLKQRLTVEKAITEEKHKQQLEELKAGLEPDAVKERVRHEREISELRKATQKAEAKEHHEQSRPGFFQKAIQDPKGAIGDLWSGLGTVIGELKEEFGKGGIGGLIDNLLGKGGKEGEGSTTNKLLGGVLGGQGGGGTLGELGGMVGEEAGGAQGAIAGKRLAEMVPKVIAAPAKLVETSLRDLGGALNSLGGTLGPIGAGFDLVGNVLGKVGSVVKAIPVVGEVLGPFVDALTAIPGILKGITKTLVSFAAKASPAQFRMFEIAVEDVQATIGQAFLPVLDLMREAVKLFGDVIASILPNTDEVGGALSLFRESFAELGGEIRELMTEIGPLIRENLIFMLQEVGFVLTVVVKIIGQWVSALTWLLRPLKGLLELMGIDTKTRTSEGAAVRPVHIGGIEEYQKQLQLEAYKQPGVMKPEERTPNILEEILSWLQDNIDIDSAVEALGEYISKKAEKPINDFQEGFFHPVDTLRKRFGF